MQLYCEINVACLIILIFYFCFIILALVLCLLYLTYYANKTSLVQLPFKLKSVADCVYKMMRCVVDDGFVNFFVM
jgi:hypothetical protein